MKEKARNLQDRSRKDNLRLDGIPEYEEETQDVTEKLLKNTLCEKLCVIKIQIKRAHRDEAKAADKDRTAVARFSSYKGKQRVLNETSCKKRENIIFMMLKFQSY